MQSRRWRPADTFTLPSGTANPSGVYTLEQPWPPGEFERHYCEDFVNVSEWFARGPGGHGIFVLRTYLDRLEGGGNDGT